MKTIVRGIVLTALLCVFTFVFNDTDVRAQGKSDKKGPKMKDEVGPPPWAPAHGYRAKTRYVFFRDYAVYYDHERQVYISLAGKDWQVSADLPVNLKGVDLQAAVKIDLEANGDNPQRDYKEHRQKYVRLD
jgi:hypothetical protein